MPTIHLFFPNQVPQRYTQPGTSSGKQSEVDPRHTVSPSRFKDILTQDRAPTKPKNQLSPEYNAAFTFEHRGSAEGAHRQHGQHREEEQVIAHQMEVALKAQKRARQVKRASPLAARFSFQVNDPALHALKPEAAGGPPRPQQAPAPSMPAFMPPRADPNFVPYGSVPSYACRPSHKSPPSMPTYKPSNGIVGFNGRRERRVSFTRSAVDRKEGEGSYDHQYPRSPAQPDVVVAPPKQILALKSQEASLKSEAKSLAFPPQKAQSRGWRPYREASRVFNDFNKPRTKRTHRTSLPSCYNYPYGRSPYSSSSTTFHDSGCDVTTTTNVKPVLPDNKRGKEASSDNKQRKESLTPLPKSNPFYKRTRSASLSAVAHGIPGQELKRHTSKSSNTSSHRRTSGPAVITNLFDKINDKASSLFCQ